MELNRECSYSPVTFSVNSLEILDRLHHEYTPGELVDVMLSLRNPGSLQPLCRSGRDPENSFSADHSEYSDDTPVCASGFIINMVTRSLRLISPCRPDERWPRGEYVWETARFKDADELGEVMDAMMSRHMPETLPDDFNVRFRRDLNFRALLSGFEVSNSITVHRMEKSMHHLPLGKMMRQGQYTAAEIVEDLSSRGFNGSSVRRSLDLLFDRGLLSEEPDGTAYFSGAACRTPPFVRRRFML